MRWRVARSASDVDAAAWNALTDDVELGHAWFRALELSRTPRVDARHVVVEEGDRVVAVLPCFLACEDPYYTVRERIFGPLRVGPGRRGRPALVAYSPLVQRTVLLRDEKAGAAQVLPLCFEATRAICEQEGVDLECWPFVSDEDAELARALREHGYANAFLAPRARLDTSRFASFEEYLARFKSVSQKRHKQLRNEINRFRRSGVEIRETGLRAVDPDQLARLQQTHYGRHNEGAPSPYGSAFFGALARELGETALLHAAWREGELVSYSVVLAGALRWHMFLSGDLDEESAHAGRLHFSLNYYYPTERAIERGVRELDYGLSTYDLKLRRGCALEPVRLYARSHDALMRSWLPGWLSLVDRWYRRKHAALPTSDWDPHPVVQPRKAD